MRSPLIISSRGSDLARWQADFVKSLLDDIGLTGIVNTVESEDATKQRQDKTESNSNYSNEVEKTLLNGESDIAVHAFKDLPEKISDKLFIAAITERDDPSDIFIIRKESYEPKNKFGLKREAVVGLYSARRKSQLLAFRADVRIFEIHGDVSACIQTLRDGLVDAILIASAGIERLGIDISEFQNEKTDPREFIPAPAQGVIAILVRKDDKELIQALKSIDHTQERILSGIERKIIHQLALRCDSPVGVYATYDDETEDYAVSVVKAKAADDSPVCIFTESKSPEQLIQRAVDKVNSVKPCTVFITRPPRKESFLRNVLEGNSFKLEERALIEIIPIPFRSIPDCDWIFFSSKHAVKYFFQQKPALSTQKFACVGKSTSDALRQFGKRADFIGSSTDTKMTGKQFASRTGNSKVLFPQAKGSMRSIQRQFVKQENVIDLVVYETLKKNDGEMPTADIVVFTSPSNVDAWFENYKFQKNQKAIAMGDATSQALRRQQVIPLALTDSFDDAGLARAVFGVSGTD